MEYDIIIESECSEESSGCEFKMTSLDTLYNRFILSVACAFNENSNITLVFSQNIFILDCGDHLLYRIIEHVEHYEIFIP